MKHTRRKYGKSQHKRMNSQQKGRKYVRRTRRHYNKGKKRMSQRGG